MFRRFLLKAMAGALAFAMAFTVPVVSVEATECDNEDKYKVQHEDAQLDEEKEYATTSYTSTCGNYKYVINEDGTIALTDYLGSETVVTVPAQLDGYTVSRLGENMFRWTDVTEIIISEGITTASEGAFTNLDLKKVSIPASMTDIADNVTDGRVNRMSVTIDEANPAYKVENDALVTADGKKLLIYINTSHCESYTVADGIEFICPYAFADSEIDNLVISDSVSEIGEYAFNIGYFNTVTFGKGLTTIGECAFAQNRIKNITIPGNVKVIGYAAFTRSYLETVVIEEGVETLGEYSFYNANLKSVTIPASVNSIGNVAFCDNDNLSEIVVAPENKSYKMINDALCTYDGKSLLAYCVGKPTQVYAVPNGVEIIGYRSFSQGKNLVSLTIPEGVTFIDDAAFNSCTALKEVKLPYSLEKVDASGFENCKSLEAIVLTGKLELVHSYFFAGCTSLNSVFIPSEVKTIYSYAFRDCTALTDIYYVGSEAEWNEIKITDKDNDALKTATIHYLGNLRDFVSRMYSVALNRDYDAAGLNGWVQHLVEETHDGAGLAKEFVLGPEFALRNLTDEQYVDTLYTTFFNREADAAGKQLWLATLANGGTREYVLSQFVNLDEFTLLCESYGINRGVMFENGVASNPGVVKFVNRLYTLVMGRGADADGLYLWTISLSVGAETAESAAKSFFNGEEYALRNTDNATYVNDLYKVFMDREADAEGQAFWVMNLEAGFTRDDVLSEFAKSEEFAVIAASYGLQ